VVVLLVATAATVLLAIVSLGIGDFRVAPARVVEILLGFGDRRETLVISGIRLPRILLAIIVGIALAISGAIVQTIARNGLASPDLLGVTSGAGAGAIAVIVLGGTIGSGTAVAGGQAIGLLRTLGVPGAALVGGFAAAALVVVVLRITGSHGLRPILVGVGVSAFFGGLTSWMLVVASIDDAARANAWLTGSLGGGSWPEVATVGLATTAVVLVLIPVSSRLPALELGSDAARSLGVRVPLTTGLLLAGAVVLAAVSASAVGPIGFVALVAPHLARLATAAPRAPLAVSAVIGAFILLVSDLIARTVVAPILLPTGAVTALVGAPFLVWLLVRSRKDLVS
jgi:iron complex transport system permease protein